MAIKIPLELVNQTGPEWDKFVKQAQKAGFELKDIGNVGNEVFDNIVKRKAKESRDAVDKLADSFVDAQKQTRGLSDTVRYLNAMNITPRGYEMYTYRMSLMAENLGKSLVPIALLGGTAAGAIASVNALADRGDEKAIALQRSWLSVGNAIGFVGRQALQALGANPAFQKGEGLLTGFNNDLARGIVHGVDQIAWGWNDAYASLAKFAQTLPFVNKEQRAILETIIEMSEQNKKARKEHIEHVEALRGKDLIDEMKRPIQQAFGDDKKNVRAADGTVHFDQGTQGRLQMISGIKTMVDLRAAELRLQREITELANKGAFREEEQAKFTRELIAIEEKRRQLLMQQAAEINKAEAALRRMAEQRAAVFSGKADGAGRGLAEDIRNSASPQEVMRQMAQNRAEQIAKQRGITDPDQIRKLAAGQLSAIERGGIGVDQRGRRYLSQEEIARAQSQVGRRKITALVETGKIDSVTAQGLSDAYEARGREFDEAATMRDNMAKLNRRGYGRASRNAFDRASKIAQQQVREGAAVGDQGTDRLSGAIRDVAQREAEAFRTRENADARQMDLLKQLLDLSVSEIRANRTRDLQLQTMIRDVGSARASRNQFAN